MQKSLVRCIVNNQEGGGPCVQDFPGYYAGRILEHPLYIYKNPVSSRWYIIDEFTGASVTSYSTKKEAIQGLEYAARMLELFIEKNPANYERFCDRFTSLFNQYLREINANV